MVPVGTVLNLKHHFYFAILTCFNGLTLLYCNFLIIKTKLLPVRYTIEVIIFFNFLKIAAKAAKIGRPTLSHSHQKKGCSATLTPRLPGTIEPYRTPGSIPMASARPECSTGHSHVASCQTMCDSASALAKPNCCPRTVLYKSSQEARDQNTLAYPLPPPTPEGPAGLWIRVQ